MTAPTTRAIPSAWSSALTGFGRAGARAARLLIEAWRHRHDAAVLAAFDDRMLADIGLTRGDLYDALSEPLWGDPTSVLARRERERRQVRRAVADELVKPASPAPVSGAGPDRRDAIAA